MTDAMNTATAETTTSVRSRRGRRALGLVLVILLILLGLASYLLYQLIVPRGTGPVGGDTGGTSGLTWVRSIYGKSDQPMDQFDRTQAAVPGPDGSIWITDGATGTIMRFTPDGRYVSEVVGPEDDPLFIPSRFDVAPDGTLYVCETQLGAIRVLDQQGNDAGSFGVPSPVSVAVNDDRVVVGSVMGFAILDRANPEEPLKVVGSRGKEDWQFDYVHGVAIGDNGNVYVVDSWNNRLSAYDPDGNRLWIVRTGAPTNSAEMVDGRLTVTEEATSTLTGDDALQLPLGLTIDAAGRLVVIDMFECALAVFNAEDGSFVGKYGDYGPEDGEFFYPVSVSYDPARDWFTVADNLNNRVQVVRIPGSAADAGAVAAVRRALAGPLRACLLPLALLLLAVLVWLFTRSRRRKGADSHVAVQVLSVVADEEEGVTHSGSGI